MHPLPPQLQLHRYGVVRSHHPAVGCSNWQLRPHFHWAQGQDEGAEILVTVQLIRQHMRVVIPINT